MFTIGQEYDRQELLNFVGSKQNQSGIIWGNKEPGCVIVTSGGKHGVSAGYGDTKNEDGSWYYVGQGSKGDQSERNIANSLLVKRQKSIFLFTTREPTASEQRARGNSRRKLYKFEGVFETLSHDFQIPKTGKRTGDKLVVFHLMPAANIYTNTLLPISTIGNESLASLKAKIFASQGKDKPSGITSPKEYRIRSEYVKMYALLRAIGICEFCDSPAPFLDINQIPFLEVHHIFKLADDGLDLPHNVAAICPNCHRAAHFGTHREHMKETLAHKISIKEGIH